MSSVLSKSTKERVGDYRITRLYLPLRGLLSLPGLASRQASLDGGVRGVVKQRNKLSIKLTGAYQPSY